MWSHSPTVAVRPDCQRGSCSAIKTLSVTRSSRLLRPVLPLRIACWSSFRSTIFMERFEAGRCLQLIQEQGITILYSIPLHPALAKYLAKHQPDHDSRLQTSPPVL